VPRLTKRPRSKAARWEAASVPEDGHMPPSSIGAGRCDGNWNIIAHALNTSFGRILFSKKSATFWDQAPERDEEKRTPVFRQHPAQTLGIDHNRDLSLVFERRWHHFGLKYYLCCQRNGPVRACATMVSYKMERGELMAERENGSMDPWHRARPRPRWSGGFARR